MENSFWNIGRDDNFVKLFKKSFALYDESGMRKETEAEVDILRNEQGRSPDFKKKFCNFITEHYLRKILLFLICTEIHLTTFFTQIQPTLGMIKL